MDFEKEKEKRENLKPEDSSRESLFSITNIPVEKKLSFMQRVDYFLRKDMLIGRQLWVEELEKRLSLIHI